MGAFDDLVAPKPPGAFDDLVKDPTLAGEAKKGLIRGVDNLQQGLYGAAAAAGNATGLKLIEDYGREGVARNQQEAMNNPAAVPRVQDIGSVKDAALWAAGGLGELAPFMAESAAEAAAGAALGGAIGGPGGAVVGGGAAMLNRARKIGGTLAAGIGSIAQETGSIAADQIGEGNLDPAKALAYGVPAGLLDVLPAARVIDKLGTPIAKGARMGAVRDVGTQMAAESVTEGGQTALERMGAGKEALDAEGRSEIINAMALGGLGGGVVGAGGRALEGAFAKQPETAPGDAGAGGAPQIAGLLPAPGQAAIQAGSGDMRTGEQAQAEIDAVRNWTEVNEARRAEEQRKADLAAQQPPQIAGLLPAPGQSSGDRQIPPTVGPIGTELDLEQQAAADNAAAIYGARAAKDQELAALAAQGPISAAAATSIRTGLADQQTARRQGEIDDAVGQADEPLAMPAAAGEAETATQKQLDEWLTAAPRASLYAAQMAASTSSTPVTVVPHPAGGFTIAPSTLLNPRQAEAVQAIQSPESEVIRPESGPRDMPFLTPEAAKKVADKRMAATGVEHTVVPHPTKGNAFAVKRVEPGPESRQGVENTGTQFSQSPAAQAQNGGIPAQAGVQDAAAFTGREQAPAVNAQADIAAAANEAATSLKNDLPQPTAAQALAGNYKKGHVKVHGLDVSVENPDGSVRVAKDGSWASGTKGHYGYIRRSKGADGDQVDVNVGPKPESPKVFVVNQNDPKSGKFDEHKVMLGYETAAEAEAAYRANYPADWNGLGSVVETDVKGLKSWLKSGEAKTPFAAAAKPAPKLSAEALAGITIKQPVQLEETGETVYVERDAKTALVESRSRARKLEALLKCLRS